MKTVKLYTLCSQIVDCPHQTPVWLNEGIFVVRNYNLINGRIDKKNASYVDEETYKKRIKRATPESGDIIISREAPMGVVGIVPEGMKCCLGQRLVLLKINKNECDASYLLYMLQSYYVQNQIKQIDKTGSIVSNLNIPDLKNLDIPYVDISIQKKINKILSTLDNKIDLNKNINEELETIAKELYVYWFVQNADKRWEKKRLDELGNLKNGVNYEKANIIGDKVKIVNVRDISASSIFIEVKNLDEIYLQKKEIEKYMLDENDIIFARSGVPGETRLIEKTEEKIIFCGFAIRFRLNDKILKPYLYFTLKQNEKITRKKSGGSIMPNISQDSLKDISIMIPPIPILQKFNKTVSSIFLTIIKNQQENAYLAQLRDFLLPLLMNGQVKVKNR